MLFARVLVLRGECSHVTRLIIIFFWPRVNIIRPRRSVASCWYWSISVFVRSVCPSMSVGNECVLWKKRLTWMWCRLEWWVGWSHARNHVLDAVQLLHMGRGKLWRKGRGEAARTYSEKEDWPCKKLVKTDRADWGEGDWVGCAKGIVF